MSPPKSTGVTVAATSNDGLIEGKYTEEHLFNTARTIVLKKTDGSKILDINAENEIPKFHEKELTLSKVLGRGGFCVVNEISKITLIKEFDDPAINNKTKQNDKKEEHDEHYLYNIIQDRAFMELHHLRGKGKDCRYAIKKLQPSCRKDASTFVNGIVDLAVEAKFLSVVRHANIIKMRAMSIGTPYDDQFFVILDRLYDTLYTRLNTWKKQKVTGMKKLLDRGGKKELSFFTERLEFGYDLACALKYLHESHIMYRDIKPDNIGFDIRGDIKIFDFGLAKEFDPAARDDQGLYNFTADTGSPRYMDPLVAAGRRYNELCDVYSFSILLWQMLEVETPFDGFTMNMFNKKVVQEGCRPSIGTNSKWSIEIQNVLKNGWGNILQRNNMIQVCEIIRKELSLLKGEDVIEFTDASKKSDASIKNLRKSLKSSRELMGTGKAAATNQPLPKNMSAKVIEC